MLIVTRRKGQRIVLGPDIEIVVTDIARSGVKIGIVAPSSLTILRGEVKDAVEQANREALESSFDAPVAAATPAASDDSVVAPVEAPASAVAGAPQTTAVGR
ncbi:MAG: carbon storage regulator [Myxococcales bacterium]|jgi:carbon storage regulator